MQEKQVSLKECDEDEYQKLSFGHLSKPTNLESGIQERGLDQVYKIGSYQRMAGIQIHVIK